jgi:hypothetical protein
MKNRKVHYIDVSKMSEREICKLLNIPYVPWYRSTVFWSMVIVLCMPVMLLWGG